VIPNIMKILLHICCGVCAAPAVEWLMAEGHVVTGFFYNPNIHPAPEYEKRLMAAKKAASELGFKLEEGLYDREVWFEAVNGTEHVSEGGKRCGICFEMRLRKTYERMKKNMCNAFTTTLSVSPHKNVSEINAIGRAIGGERFISADFKRRGGFQRAGVLAKEWGLYRQNYCGCIYSLEERLRKDASSQG